ncbi:MAG: GNAT family N-acetyltransferase [Ectothiorhodospiraceae bacterium]|nr:GNAT family N-acetyltransferase [Ectothiorhodospiraceae bacterium]
MIRPMASHDMDSILTIWLEASIESHDFVSREFWESRLEDMRNVYIPASETYIYETDGTVKGFFSLHGNTLAAIFVSPGCQGEGIGQKLMEKVKELRNPVCLDVYRENHRTVAFYRRCGFRELAEKRDPHTGHVELVMEYRA